MKPQSISHFSDDLYAETPFCLIFNFIDFSMAATTVAILSGATSVDMHTYNLVVNNDRVQLSSGSVARRGSHAVPIVQCHPLVQSRK